MVLRDPRLPLLKLNEMLASISGRIPQQVELSIRQHLLSYEAHITSALVQFPCHAIGLTINSHASSLQRPVDRQSFLLITNEIVQLIQRFRGGLRGHIESQVRGLFAAYFSVERLFQDASYEKCVADLVDAHKDAPDVVIRIIFSHNQIEQKRALISLLMEHLQNNEPGLTKDLADTLSELATLRGGQLQGRLSLQARQSLMAAQQPVYDQRLHQMESILLSAVDVFGYEYHPGKLQRLVRLQTSIFDVLHRFFYHPNSHVCQAALEIYIRRAYISYNITCVAYLNALADGSSHHIPCVHFEFELPLGHPNRLAIDSNGPLTRESWVVAFESFKLFQASSRHLWMTIGMYKTSSETKSNKQKGDTFILNVAIKCSSNMGDEDRSQIFCGFCKDNQTIITELGIRRVTFLVLIE